MPSIQIINHTNNMFRRTEPIKYIILHYSASTQSKKDSAWSTVRTLDQRGYSSDFAVDDNDILQFADDPAKWASTAVQRPNKNGTAAGKNARNANAVSIEMSSTLALGGKWEANNPLFKFSDKVLENTTYLCRVLISKYNIPKENVIRHYDIMGKACPGIIGWNLASGSDNENQYRAFVDNLYSDNPQTLPPMDVDYVNTYVPSYTSGFTQTKSRDIDEQPSLGTSNNVMRLSSANKKDKSVLKQDDSRKQEFESLITLMSSNAPNMGRDVIITSELFDSNILKGNQESTKERV